VFATVAIVISLVFVGLQIRENTEETRAANRQSLATRAQELALFSAQIGGGINALYRYDQLTPEQQAAAVAWIPALVRNVEEAYLIYRDGRLDEEYWLTRAAVLNEAMGSEVGMRVYKEMETGAQLVPDFVRAMDEYRVAH
jgi:hypothetical protein